MFLKKYHNVIKFITSGGLAALTEYSVFLVLHHVDVQLILANALSFCCGLVVSFTLNKHWVFSRKGNGSQQFVLYACLAVINLFLSSALIVFLVHVVRIPPIVSKICVMGLIASWNYIIFQKVIFKHRSVL
jgi:putative flippase GtrA